MSKRISFLEWSTKSIMPVNAQAAWQYQQKIIDQLEADFAEAVCWGKDQLRLKIEQLQKENNELRLKLYGDLTHEQKDI